MREKSLEETVKQLQAKVDELERRAAPLPLPRRSKRLVVGLGVLVTAGLALAQPVPNVFQPDTPALSADVNANFADLVSRISALTTRVTAAEANTVPARTIAFFDLPSCPIGWSAYDPARGRAIVGLPAAFNADGGVGGTQGGAPLSDRESRTHGHQWARFDTSEDWYSFNSVGAEELVVAWSDGMDSNGVGEYPLGTSGAGARTLFTDRQNSGMPYVQLLACRKI